MFTEPPLIEAQVNDGRPFGMVGQRARDPSPVKQAFALLSLDAQESTPLDPPLDTRSGAPLARVGFPSGGRGSSCSIEGTVQLPQLSIGS